MNLCGMHEQEKHIWILKLDEQEKKKFTIWNEGNIYFDIFHIGSEFLINSY